MLLLFSGNFRSASCCFYTGILLQGPHPPLAPPLLPALPSSSFILPQPSPISPTLTSIERAQVGGEGSSGLGHVIHPWDCQEKAIPSHLLVHLNHPTPLHSPRLTSTTNTHLTYLQSWPQKDLPFATPISRLAPMPLTNSGKC